MTIVPFVLQAGVGCSSPATLALSLAAEFHAVDEAAADDALDTLALELTPATRLAPEDALELLADRGRQFAVRRVAARRDELQLDRLLEHERGHHLLLAIALTEAANRVGLPIGLVGNGLDVLLADQRLDRPLLLDPVTGRTRAPGEDERPGLSWRCGHQLAFHLLREHIDAAVRTGDLGWALHACDLRLALPLSEQLDAAARAERDALRARLNSAAAGEHRLVVVPGVDVEGDGARDRHVDHVIGPAVEQLPDALVAVQRREVGEDRSRERERMPATVLVAAGGQRRVAAAGKQHRDGLRRHARLVAQHQDEHVGARVDRAEGGGDRRRAALAELLGSPRPRRPTGPPCRGSARPRRR